MVGLDQQVHDVVTAARLRLDRSDLADEDTAREVARFEFLTVAGSDTR